MKRFVIFSFILICFLKASTVFSQATLRVDNTPGITLGTNTFAKLQAAHDAARSGDTIYVKGSPQRYDPLICTKRLIWIGPGYFLGEHDGDHASISDALINSWTFKNGSDGSSLSGFCGDTNGYLRASASNLTITRNRGLRIVVADVPASNIVISKNYDVRITHGLNQPVSGLVITNNHVAMASLQTSAISGTFKNNVITTNNVSYGFMLKNFIVSNNILLFAVYPKLTDCSVRNNIDARATNESELFGTDKGNLANVDKTLLFVGGKGSTDGQWKLKPGSPAIGAGLQGEDCGIFGGSDPYVLSGIQSVQKPVAVQVQKPAQSRESTKVVDAEPPVPAGQLPVYYSLFIGVEKYQFASASLPNLDKPIKDAGALRNAILTGYAFPEDKSTFLKNPTRADIINALEDLSKKITPRDNLLIFYAGHGFWDERLKIGYWLPSDGKADDKSNWISNSTIRDYIAGIQSKHTLLVTDACFGGSIFKTREVSSELNVDAMSKVYRLPSRKAMTSGTLTTVPDESKFMEYLMKRLTDNTSEYLSARQLFYSLETAVLNNTNTVPQLGVIQDTGDEGGDFVFIKSKK